MHPSLTLYGDRAANIIPVKIEDPNRGRFPVRARQELFVVCPAQHPHIDVLGWGGIVVIQALFGSQERAGLLARVILEIEFNKVGLTADRDIKLAGAGWQLKGACTDVGSI